MLIRKEELPGVSANSWKNNVANDVPIIGKYDVNSEAKAAICITKRRSCVAYLAFTGQ